MDQAREQGSGEVLDLVDEGMDKKLSHSVEGLAVTTDSLDERASISGKDGTSKGMDKDLGSNKQLQEGSEELTDHGTHDQPNNSETLHGLDQGTSFTAGNLLYEGVLDAVVVIDSSGSDDVSGDNRKLEGKVNESGLSKVHASAPKRVSERDNNSCVIDIKCSSYKGISENLDGERICRICHLASGQSSDATFVRATNDALNSELIQLGCACKDELGIAHSHCAEAWFKLKGNRFCEICGETAKNVTGVVDNGFMEEWNERRFLDSGIGSSGMFRRCWRGQPFCNFLMACLVIAFVLPWFFRVNMF
ncbi:hypothetical protein L6164_031751 [Bauhinia variegata]|uniref:Uncharacterized protein n=1 Tax=Bauhinia variegata TaxID=167791 RepID=A0ACB9KLH9_BAUVA|nr:hypothetical protein L6164_031751 [Bauhinia variegata]